MTRRFGATPGVNRTPSARRDARLAWGPGHGSPAQDVAVQVKDALAGVGALIDDEPVPAAREAESLGDIPRRQKNMPERLGVLGLRLVDAGHVNLRDDEGMHGSG